MTYYLLKLAISAVLIVMISELAKRSGTLGGLLASLPLVSLLAMVWLYVDTQDTQKVAALSTSIFWLVLPSLTLFIALPLLLKQGLGFYLSLGIATGVMLGSYALMLLVLRHFGAVA